MAGFRLLRLSGRMAVVRAAARQLTPNDGAQLDFSNSTSRTLSTNNFYHLAKGHLTRDFAMRNVTP